MRRHIRILPATLAAFALVFAADACAPGISVGVNTATDLRPAAYRTFSWELPDEFPTGDARLDNNPFFVRELQNAVATELAKIGLREASDASDLVVHFHATVRDRVDVYEADRRAGYDITGYPAGSPLVQQYEEGTVLVDVAERTSKKLIWRGWMQTDLSGTIGDNAALGERVRRGMKVLFTRFPKTAISAP
ncbi:MAG: DUF4136 domain-containing protein [Gemmatimonadetes bacterium]|nr:DUF4136 domain-containing protein [Gemmatimonadota bacterium]